MGDVWLIGLTKETLGGLGRRWPPPCVQARLGRRGHTWTLRECWSRVGAGGRGATLQEWREDRDRVPVPSQPPPSRKEVACCKI